MAVSVNDVLRYVERVHGVTFGYVDQSGTAQADGKVVSDFIRAAYTTTDGDPIEPSGGSDYATKVSDVQTAIATYLAARVTANARNNGYDGTPAGVSGLTDLHGK